MIANTPVSKILLTALVVFAILAGKMWKKLPEGHPAVVKMEGIK